MKADEAKSWWAFQPLRKTTAPTSLAFVSTQIDTFLNARLQAEGLQPSAPADKRTLLRRATYDLTGLPPSPRKLTHSLRILHWKPSVKSLNVSLPHRNTASNGGGTGLMSCGTRIPPTNTDRPLMHAWRYRNWVFDAFNKDQPYNEFVRLQLTETSSEPRPHERNSTRES